MTQTSERFSTRPGETDHPRVEKRGNVWHVRGTMAVRAILREKDGTTQAGFTSEAVNSTLKEQPILFMDGEEHRRQRSKVARFFAPKTVSTRYRELMESRADRLVDEMWSKPSVLLEGVTLRYSVEVAAQVIGLTNSPVDAMSRHLDALMDHPEFDLTKPNVGRSRFQTLQAAASGTLPMLVFYWKDVRPAILARQKERQEDVISHLLDEGYSHQGILIECVTYGAAGMITTREFISMALLHLVRNEALRERYLAAEEPERLDILHEILRLEPVVGHLFRRAQRDIEVSDGACTHTIRKGDLVDLGIRQANADADVVGPEPLRVCPGRDLPRGVGEEVMSFGDGAHKCPGNALAIQESDIFLTRLLRRGVRIVHEPRLEWDEIISGYALRDFEITVG